MESGKLNAFFIHITVLRLWVLDVVPTIARNAVILVERSSSDRGDVREWVGMWGKWKENRRNAKEKHHVYWRLCTIMHYNAMHCCAHGMHGWRTACTRTSVVSLTRHYVCLLVWMLLCYTLSLGLWCVEGAASAWCGVRRSFFSSFEITPDGGVWRCQWMCIRVFKRKLFLTCFHGASMSQSGHRIKK